MTNLQILFGFLGTVVVAAGGWFAAHAARKASPYDSLASRVLKLEEQRQGDLAQIEKQQTEITGLKRRVAGVIEDRDALVAYVASLREWVVNGARPPAPDVPRHLADVLPPWVLADDGPHADTPPHLYAD